MQTTNYDANSRDFTCTVENKHNMITFTVTCEAKHPSSFIISFQSPKSIIIYDDENDPEITKVSKHLEKLGFRMVMDNTEKFPGRPAKYSLCFKKENGKDPTNKELMDVTTALAVLR